MERQPSAPGLASAGETNLDAGQPKAFRATVEWILCGLLFVGEIMSLHSPPLPANKVPGGPLGTLRSLVFLQERNL